MAREASEKDYAPSLSKPVMRVGAVADLLGVCPRMVRIYEERGLVRPERKNNQRLYSFNDVRWLARIRQLMNEEGYDMGDIARLISLPACWQLMNCDEEKRANCSAARSPGKRCWEADGQRQGLVACEVCQIYRISTGAV